MLFEAGRVQWFHFYKDFCWFRGSTKGLNFYVLGGFFALLQYGRRGVTAPTGNMFIVMLFFCSVLAEMTAGALKMMRGDRRGNWVVLVWVLVIGDGMPRLYRC